MSVDGWSSPDGCTDRRAFLAKMTEAEKKSRPGAGVGAFTNLASLSNFAKLLAEVNAMAVRKSKPNQAGASRRRRGRGAIKTAFASALLVDAGKAAPGSDGLKLKLKAGAYEVLKQRRAGVEQLLSQYGDALVRSERAGHAVSFRVEVDPAGAATIMPVEEAPANPPPAVEEVAADADLKNALAAARERGRLRAAEILSADDMLSADAFAKLLGTSRVTVNSKRQSGQLLGLDGAKRGFRFPTWQLDADDKPFAALAALHGQLGGAWAVYRFLVQPHGELDGLTGLEALKQEKSKAVLHAAESVARDFR